MKTLLLSLMMLGILPLSYGQKTFILSMQDKRAFISASAGISLPIGEYGSQAPGDERAGMAGPGIAVSLSGGYRLFDHIGLMLKAEQHRNRVRTSEPDGLTYGTDNTGSGSWVVTTIMGGPYITIPKGRFSLDGRLLAGWAGATMPDLQAGSLYVIPSTSQRIASTSSALTAGIGATIRYRLNPWLATHLNGDISYAVLTFNTLSTNSWNTANSSERMFYGSDRQICTLSLSAGITILLVNHRRPF